MPKPKVEREKGKNFVVKIVNCGFICYRKEPVPNAPYSTTVIPTVNQKHQNTLGDDVGQK